MNLWRNLDSSWHQIHFFICEAGELQSTHTTCPVFSPGSAESSCTPSAGIEAASLSCTPWWESDSQQWGVQQGQDSCSNARMTRRLPAIASVYQLMFLVVICPSSTKYPQPTMGWAVTSSRDCRGTGRSTICGVRSSEVKFCFSHFPSLFFPGPPLAHLHRWKG